MGILVGHRGRACRRPSVPDARRAFNDQQCGFHEFSSLTESDVAPAHAAEFRRRGAFRHARNL
jgi:hypothetical protein